MILFLFTMCGVSNLGGISRCSLPMLLNIGLLGQISVKCTVIVSDSLKTGLYPETAKGRTSRNPGAS